MTNLQDFLNQHKLMSRFYPLSVFTAVSLLLFSCAPKEQGRDVPQMTFTASQESGAHTKTSLNGTKVLWSASDKITVFSGSCPGGETYTINSEDAGKGEAKFTGNAVGAAPWYALYPADEMASFGQGAVSLALPAVQAFAADGFADGVNPMVAVSSTEKLSFKNLCGILSLKLTGSATITSVEITTAADEALWGTGTVDMSWTEAPALVMTAAADDEHRKLTLDCGEGVALGSDPTTFNFVVPAGTLGGGFTVVVKDSNGSQMEKTTANTGLVAERAKVKRLNSIEYIPTVSGFLTHDVFGIYDLSSGKPVAVRAYEKGVDQYALHFLANANEFRIQNLEKGFALFVTYPSGLNVGDSCQLTIASIGETGVDDATANAVLVKRESNKIWLQDSAAERGYILYEDAL